jgi:hypothetical protein
VLVPSTIVNDLDVTLVEKDFVAIAFGSNKFEFARIDHVSNEYAQITYHSLVKGCWKKKKRHGQDWCDQCHINCIIKNIKKEDREKRDELLQDLKDLSKDLSKDPAVNSVCDPADGTVRDPPVRDPADGTVRDPAVNSVCDPADGTVRDPAVNSVCDPADGTAPDVLVPSTIVNDLDVTLVEKDFVAIAFGSNKFEFARIDLTYHSLVKGSWKKKKRHGQDWCDQCHINCIIKNIKKEDMEKKNQLLQDLKDLSKDLFE